jgi:hypothetical protein
MIAMPRTRATYRASRTGALAALSTLIGIVLSGPPALIVLSQFHPQPPWEGAEAFSRSFHPIQTFPYFAGFFLVGGYVALMASLHAVADGEHKPRATMALVLTAAFAALVFLNYIVQTTFVPELARNYSPQDDGVIAALSMSNPASLGWAIEMWAWGLLGVATWLIAPVLGSDRLERLTGTAFVANGAVSVLAAICTAVRPTWVTTPVGLVGYSLWNVLVFVMSGLAFVALRRRMRDAEERPWPLRITAHVSRA